MEPLATVYDLSDRGITAEPAALAESLLASVSAAVREAAGSPISLEESTITLAGSPSQWLPLNVYAPRVPSTVSIDGQGVTDYTLVDGKLWRQSGWVTRREPSLVNVTLEHGLDEVPADIVNMVCMFVAAGMSEAKSGFAKPRGRQYVSLDDWREGFTTGDREIVDPTELTDRVKASLRRRFSGSVTVTGGY